MFLNNLKTLLFFQFFYIMFYVFFYLSVISLAFIGLVTWGLGVLLLIVPGFILIVWSFRFYLKKCFQFGKKLKDLNNSLLNVASVSVVGIYQICTVIFALIFKNEIQQTYINSEGYYFILEILNPFLVTVIIQPELHLYVYLFIPLAIVPSLFFYLGIEHREKDFFSLKTFYGSILILYLTVVAYFFIKWFIVKSFGW